MRRMEMVGNFSDKVTCSYYYYICSANYNIRLLFRPLLLLLEKSVRFFFLYRCDERDYCSQKSTVTSRLTGTKYEKPCEEEEEEEELSWPLSCFPLLKVALLVEGL
jgi:hypothetical protein